MYTSVALLSFFNNVWCLWFFFIDVKETLMNSREKKKKKEKWELISFFFKKKQTNKYKHWYDYIIWCVWKWKAENME
jgi:hypothetical protein